LPNVREVLEQTGGCQCTTRRRLYLVEEGLRTACSRSQRSVFGTNESEASALRLCESGAGVIGRGCWRRFQSNGGV